MPSDPGSDAALRPHSRAGRANRTGCKRRQLNVCVCENTSAVVLRIRRASGKLAFAAATRPCARRLAQTQHNGCGRFLVAVF